MPSTPEAISADIDAATTAGFRGNLIARGQARAIIWRDGALPADAPGFAPQLSYDLHSYGYALLGLGLRLRELEGDPAQARTAFEQACLLFAKTGSDDALRTMERTLLSYNKDSPFIQDVRGQVEEQRLEKKQARPTLIDTDDPYHLLLCGTDIAGSCQHVAGDPKYNRGLVGYLLHGQIRLVAVVNDKGHIVARSLLRILWDGEKPVLFLERLYGDAQYQGAIEAMAKKKAEKMNLLLTGIDKEGLSEYEKPLKSLGGPAPYEYCDARGQGICLNGAFTIHRARVIFTPPDRAVEIRNI